jgi:long-chain-fatty-acid--CoA ligase ACSBG
MAGGAVTVTKDDNGNIFIRPRTKGLGAWAFLPPKPSKSDTPFVTEPDAAAKTRKAHQGIASLEAITMINIFKKAAAEKPEAVALRVEDGNSWKQWTYKQYFDDTLRCARALIKLGVAPHQSVNIMGHNSPQWMLAGLGAIAAGAKCVGVYSTNEAEACGYIAKHSDAVVVIVDNERQLAKYLACQPSVPTLKAIVMYGGTKPAPSDQNANSVPVYSWDQFMSMSNETSESDLMDRIKAQLAGHCAALVYTSGTTGAPKGVMVSNDNLTWTSQSLLAHLRTYLPGFCDKQEHILSYLPLPHIAGFLLDVVVPIIATATMPGSVTVSFAKPDALKGTLVNSMRKVRPTFFFGVPRVWEKFEELLQREAAKSSGITSMISSWAKGQAIIVSEAEELGGSGEKGPFFPLAKGLVLDNIHKTLGLDRCIDMCFTGAAPTPKETLKYFDTLYLKINELYGMTECAGPHTVSLGNVRRVGAVGPILPGVEMKLFHDKQRDQDGEGEICFRGRHVMMGYLRDPANSALSIDKDGFLHSGDMGRVDEYGMLYITGRIKELIVSAGGENVAPGPIEDAIRSLMPAVSNAVVIGDKKKYLSVLLWLKVEPNDDGSFGDNLSAAALSQVRSSSKTVPEAKNDPQWMSYLQAALDKYNKDFAMSSPTRVQKFAVMPGDLSVTTGELTPTLKIKRDVVEQKFAGVIDTLYV